MIRREQQSVDRKKLTVTAICARHKVLVLDNFPALPIEFEFAWQRVGAWQ